MTAPRHLTWNQIVVLGPRNYRGEDWPTCRCEANADFIMVAQPMEALIPAEDDPDGISTEALHSGPAHLVGGFCIECGLPDGEPVTFTAEQIDDARRLRDDPTSPSWRPT